MNIAVNIQKRYSSDSKANFFSAGYQTDHRSKMKLRPNWLKPITPPTVIALNNSFPST